MKQKPLKRTDAERFWVKVSKGPDCWLWTAATDRKGYGRFSVGGSHNPDGSRRNSMVAAHRFSYELACGVIDGQDGYHGICVLHKCDNPRCVRPDHLFLGSNLDNILDKVSKGRAVGNKTCGSAHANAILDEGKVRRIVERYRSGGITQRALASEFGVCLSTVNHIMTGRLWSHLGFADERTR